MGRRGRLVQPVWRASSEVSQHEARLGQHGSCRAPRMLRNHWSQTALTVACCYVFACSARSQPPSSGTNQSGGASSGVSSHQEQTGGDAGAGKAGRDATDAGVPPHPQEPVVTVGAGGLQTGAGAGASNRGGSAGVETGGSTSAQNPTGSGGQPPRDQCDLNGGCVSTCTTPSAICAVSTDGNYCELKGFVGASAEVGCGQRAIVGIACCGACECVPVEVFFDGTSCWQGMPQCTQPALSGQMFFPHATGGGEGGSFSLPDAGFPGQFYLGTTNPNAGAGGGGSDGGTTSTADRGAAAGASGSDDGMAGAAPAGGGAATGGTDSGPR